MTSRPPTGRSLRTRFDADWVCSSEKASLNYSMSLVLVLCPNCIVKVVDLNCFCGFGQTPVAVRKRPFGTVICERLRAKKGDFGHSTASRAVRGDSEDTGPGTMPKL